jgi:ABC-type glycerol-3-phosphate transport system substrate-binding protein
MAKAQDASSLTRRDFVRGAAALGAAVGAGAFSRRAAAAGPRSLKVLSANWTGFSAMMELATEPPADNSSWNLATWRLLQSWKEKYPDVQLEFVEVAPPNLTQRVILDAQSGAPADLCIVNDLNIPKLAAGGFLTPLDAFDGKWDEYNQRILRGIASREGKIYSVPWMTDCRHMYYWKEDFEKAGIAAPPATWSEMQDQLVALKSSVMDFPLTFWLGNSVQTPTQIFSQIWMLGGDIVDADGKPTLNTPEVKEVFGFYDTLVNDKKVASRDLLAISNNAQYLSLLTDHKASMYHHGSWAWGSAVAAGEADKIDYFRTPRPTADAPDATLCGFWAFQLPTQPQPDEARQQLAFEFAMHFAGLEGQAVSLGATDGRLPTRPAAVNSTEAQSKDAAWQFQAAYAGDSGRSMPAATDGGLLFDQLRIAFQRYLTGQASAADALAAAEQSYLSQVQ